MGVRVYEGVVVEESDGDGDAEGCEGEKESVCVNVVVVVTERESVGDKVTDRVNVVDGVQLSESVDDAVPEAVWDKVAVPLTVREADRDSVSVEEKERERDAVSDADDEKLTERLWVNVSDVDSVCVSVTVRDADAVDVGVDVNTRGSSPAQTISVSLQAMTFTQSSSPMYPTESTGAAWTPTDTATVYPSESNPVLLVLPPLVPLVVPFDASTPPCSLPTILPLRHSNTPTPSRHTPTVRRRAMDKSRGQTAPTAAGTSNVPQVILWITGGQGDDGDCGSGVEDGREEEGECGVCVGAGGCRRVGERVRGGVVSV